MRSWIHPEHARGLSERGERLFKRVSTSVVALLAAAWVVAISVSSPVANKINLVRQARAEPFAEKAPAESIGVLVDLWGPAVPMGANVPIKATAVLAKPSATMMPASILGSSGSLRAAIKAGVEPGVKSAAITIGDVFKPIDDFSFIVPKAASEKRKGRIGLYYLGNWPKSRTTKNGAVAYSAPEEFIEVTPSNQSTNVSEHFRLRDFLTKDQPAVWPKYLALNLKLVDKLELVLQDLKAHGIDPSGVKVMSGFRTPRYNARGGDPRGRASLSRHMYGDAADIFIDLHGTGQMSDLNRDGRVDIEDARVILAAVERVERAHPTLVGGAGVYKGTSAHGPFIHIDTRGSPARWVGTGD